MELVYQTRFGIDGNCMSACLATILQIPLETIDFNTNKGWIDGLNEKLKPFGLFYIENDWNQRLSSIPDNQLFIAIGKTDRGPLLHAVVYRGKKNGKEIEFYRFHDPHPDGTFLSEVLYLGFIALLTCSAEIQEVA